MSDDQNHQTDDDNLALSAKSVVGDRDEQLAEALEEYRRAGEAGHYPDRQSLLKRYPEIVDELSAALDSLVFIQQIGPELAEENTSNENVASSVQPLACLGDFRIVREIGRGGMGVVYEAEQLSLGRRVALKVLPFAAILDQRQLQRFKNESQAIATLHHNHIVPVYSVGCERGVHYYAMQYIEGCTLARLIRQLRHDQRPPSAEGEADLPSENIETQPIAALSTHLSTGSPEFYRSVARLGVQAAEALQYAHEEGVVHRDIKPSNLLLDQRGHLWVADFGLAQVHGGGNLTMSGDMLGTLRYMSPEQVAGKKLLDHRTDVYSLGVTLFELLTLQPVFSGHDRPGLIRHITEEKTPSARQRCRQIPADVDTILVKAMAKEPESRYQSATELAEDLTCFLNHKPIRARRPRWGDHARGWIRRNPTLFTTLAIIALLLSALAVVGPLMAVKHAKLADRADEARQQADDSRRHLQEVMDRILWQTTSSLATMGPIQRQLLDETLSFYDDLLQQRGSAPEIRFEAAMVYSRMGYVCSWSGRRQLADELRNKSFRLVDDLAKEFPSETKYRFELVELHRTLGHFERAMTIAKSLIDGDPTEPSYRRVLGNCQTFYGSRLHRDGRCREADRILGEAVASWQTLVDGVGNEMIDTTGLGFALHYSGRHHMWHGRLEEARRDLERAVGLLDSVDDYRTQAPAMAMDRAGCYRSYANLLCCFHRPSDAIPFYRKALSIGHTFVEDFPNGNGQWSLGRSYASLGDTQLSLGKKDEAENSLRNSVAYSHEIADANPDDESAQVFLAWANFRLGQVLWWAGRESEAHEEFRESLRRFEDVAATNLEIGNNYRFFTYALVHCPDPRLQNPGRAVEVATAARRVEDEDSWRDLAEAYCCDSQWQQALEALSPSGADSATKGDAYDWLLLALVHWHLNNTDEAKRWYGKAVRAIDRHQPVAVGPLLHPFDLRDLRARVERLMNTETD